MTSKESNVVQLKPNESVSQLGLINTTLTNLYQEHLFPLLDPSLKHIIDYLIQRSEHGENNSEIMRFMELKHHFEKSQTHIKDSFTQISMDNFQNWENESDSLSSLGSELSLVDNSSLDLKLAWQSAAKQLSIGDELITLTDAEYRLTPLIDLKPENNPIGPFKICESFSEALQPVNLSAEEAREVLSEFVIHIKPATAKLWQAADDYLASQGLKVVKPKTSIGTIPEQEPLSNSDSPEGLSYQPGSGSSFGGSHQGNSDGSQRPYSEPGGGWGTTEVEQTNGDVSGGGVAANPHSTSQLYSSNAPPAVNASGTAPAASYDANSIDDNLMDAIAQKVVSRVEGLLTQYSGVNGATVMEGSETEPQIAVFAAVELASTLTAIQNELSDQQTCLFDLTGSIQTALQERGVKDKISPRHNDLINIVGMLFEFILDDHELPKEVKHLIGLLQIPVLKLALLDEGFLSDREHPARQLLNDMTSAGMHTVYEPDTAEDVIELIEHTVKTIIKNFLENPDIFPACLEAFNLSLEEIMTKNQYTEEPQAKEDQKAEAENESDSYQMIKHITANYQVPPELEDFVFIVWVNVLDNCDDEDEESWYLSSNILDTLLWNLQPLNRSSITAEDWLTIKNCLLDLLTENQLDPSELSEWMNTLNVLVATPVQISDNTEAYQDTGAGSFELAIDESDDEEEEEIILSATVTAAESKYTPEESEEELPGACEAFMTDDDAESDIEHSEEKRERVDLSLSIGQWVEFIGKNGQIFRCKLASINEEADRYIFVNSAGVKVSSKRSYQLAQDISKGRLRIMDPTPFFDKALHAVMHRFLKI